MADEHDDPPAGEKGNKGEVVFTLFPKKKITWKNELLLAVSG